MKYKNTRYIELTRGFRTLVDIDDYEKLSKVKWYCTTTGYAVRQRKRILGKQKLLYLHKILIPCADGLQVDHINRDKLDNRKENLRVVTKAENNRNRTTRKDSKSGLRGVSVNGNSWKAVIMLNYKSFYIGTYKTPLQAHKAYLKAAKKYHKEYGSY